MNDFQISFEKLSMKHQVEIIDIFNYYVINTTSAFPDKSVSYYYYSKILDATKGCPAFAITIQDKTIGFCFLHAYNPFPTFSECAEITYFIDKDYTGKGIGNLVLKKLESEAKKMGIKTLLASISSENIKSINFHLKNNFKDCGRFEDIAKKDGKSFDIVWMQKRLD
ncbi:MAG: N-acetyltransferase family protein [Bacteroidales bacterium]